MDSEQAYAQVLHGEVELAVTTLGPTEPPLRAMPVWNDPLSFAVAPDHPLARLPKVSLADIAAHPAVLPDPGTFTHRIVAETFARRGLSLQLRMTTNYMETIKMMASVGLGVERAARDDGRLTGAGVAGARRAAGTSARLRRARRPHAVTRGAGIHRFDAARSFVVLTSAGLREKRRWNCRGPP